MARRQLEKLPPDRLARLDIGNLAAYLDVSPDTLEPCFTWHTPCAGRFRYADIDIKALRAVENGHAFVWADQLKRAIAASDDLAAR